MNADYSRAELLAARTSAVTGNLLTHLESQVVIVSCDHDPATVRAARILLTTLRRLPIILAFDGVGIDGSDLREIHDAVLAVDPSKPLGHMTNGFRVHIGVAGATAALRVVPVRHGARVVRDGRLLTLESVSPLGSCMAAAFAAAEVFKEVVQVRQDRRSDASYAFCPVTLTDRPELAPPLPASIETSGALVGLGAIGTATAMILGELRARGFLDLVDRERYGTENVATYSLGGLQDAEASVWKTELAARVLTGVRCTRYNDGIEDYLERVQRGEIPPPRLVLAGLDNVEARHMTQRLWPDILIDGATGNTMLGLHVVHEGGQPCMECYLPTPSNGPSPYDRLSALTGLPIEKLRSGDDILCAEDLAGVADEQRARIESQVGNKICGLAEAVGLTDLAANGFRPSAAFVSLASACLVVGRVMSTQLVVEPAENFVQYDALFGPASATVESRRAAARCYCSERASTIARIRDRRFATIPVQRGSADTVTLSES